MIGWYGELLLYSMKKYFVITSSSSIFVCQKQQKKPRVSHTLLPSGAGTGIYREN